VTSKPLAVAAFVVSAAFHAAMSLCVKLVGAQLMSRKNPGKKIHPQKTINGLSSVNLNYFHGVFWERKGGGQILVGGETKSRSPPSHDLHGVEVFL